MSHEEKGSLWLIYTFRLNQFAYLKLEFFSLCGSLIFLSVEGVYGESLKPQ